MGSSPLARGLPPQPRHARARRGIIPARAGFTAGLRLAVSHGWDHPRSRGVYACLCCPGIRSGGSSPLARGLRPGDLICGRHDRIIPARAGFTHQHFDRQSGRPDHPRSRGVYPSTASRRGRSGGSSPLARGLLLWSGWSFEGSRIIPARAGFTPPDRLGGGATADHPRSRGVYREGVLRIVPPSGSSPLARGLRSVVVTPSMGATDHPRSRGVYCISPCRRPASCGSSPLARGLPCRPWKANLRRWIIPARAGFTNIWDNEPKKREDHPRSRGVYP